MNNKKMNATFEGRRCQGIPRYRWKYAIRKDANQDRNHKLENNDREKRGLEKESWRGQDLYCAVGPFLSIDIEYFYA